MESWGTHFFSFLLGTATGAAGSYFATKYTDKRREIEGKKAEKKAFQEIQKVMPDLIREMKTAFLNPKASTVREFIILPNRKVTKINRQARFVFYCDEHNDLMGKAAILENYGYIHDVTLGSTPTYRITEDFIKFVNKS